MLLNLLKFITLITSTSYASAIWPRPRQISTGHTALKLSPSFDIDTSSIKNAPQDLSDAVTCIIDHLRNDNLHAFVVNRSTSSAGVIKSANSLRSLTLMHVSSSPVESISDEAVGYTLTVPIDGSSATLQANSTLGLLRGLTTFEQLWYTLKGTVYYLDTPFHIVDSPAYPYRGLMLDTARNYFPVDVIKHTLDAMSWVKISTFHWHVVDSQSFPLQIPGFLELSHKAAYNSSSVYTLSDVRDIVAYATACGIDVIAKINLLVIPLRYRKAILNILLVLKLLPDRLMLSGCFRVPSSRLLSSHEFILSIEPPAGQLRLARAATTNFTSGMLAAAPSLFSSHYFGTGGDEVNENCYDDDEETQRELAFDTFTHITHQALRFVGKTPTVWEGWISAHNVASLVKKGYKVIHASNEYFYLDCGAGGWLSQNPLGNTYSFGPLAGLEPSRYHLILGGQHLLWSEQADPSNLCFLEGVFWSGPGGDIGAAMPHLHEIAYRFKQRGVQTIALQPEWCALRLGHVM
ncbi:glycoside hydrolase superfamily [Gymnopilus junonius]|uniref:Beta-hexosaminidase n=1 Tax=Gymnopilus junonius TaxID=109634 RepID=A0A9P5TG73_GYMJU|nr:glycoside hydrolase superfamily [Gymnopilus junonius]